MPEQSSTNLITSAKYQLSTPSLILSNSHVQDGVPRGGYNGVVIVQWGKCRLLFSQAPDFVPPEKTIATVKVDQSGAIIRQKSRPGGL